MKKFLSLFVLFVLPVVAIAQENPQIGITNLQTAAYEFQVGQPIEGSFEIMTLDDVPGSDLTYDVAYGTYQNGALSHRFGIEKNKDVIRLDGNARAPIGFSVTPDTQVGMPSGIEVRVHDQNGTVLAKQAIPVKISGTTAAPSLLLEETEDPFVVPVTVTDTDEMIFGESELTPKPNRHAFVISDGASSEVQIDGLVATAVLFDTPSYETKVAEEELLSFVEGEYVVVDLPKVGDLSSYYGYVVFKDANGNVSNKLEVQYVNTESNAEIVNVTKQKSSGDRMLVDIEYYAFSNFNLPEDQQVTNAMFLVELLGDNGEVLTSTEVAAETPQDFGFATSTEGLEDNEAFAKTMGGTSRASAELPFDGDVNNAIVRVTMFDADTNEVLDLYETLVPTIQGYGRNVSLKIPVLLTIAALLAIVVLLILKRKIKIATVALVPLLLVGIAAGTVYVSNVYFQEGGWGMFDNGKEPSISGLISGALGGYMTSPTSLSYTASYTEKFWSNNGYHMLQIIYPKSTVWEGFEDADAAKNHYDASVNGAPKKTIASPLVRAWSLPNLASNAHYVAISKTALKVGNSTLVGSNLTLPRSASALSAGMHYFPVGTMYCRESHGCMSRTSITVYQICVYGAGVCPGESNPDLCSNIPEIQTTVPTGKVRNTDGTCSDSACYPDAQPANYDDPCGCNLGGKIMCNGSCNIADACSTGLSCAVSPSNTVNLNQTVTFTASSNGSGSEYRWSDSPSSWSSVFSSDNDITDSYSSAGTFQKYLQIDTNNDNASDDQVSCAVTAGCSGSQPGNQCVEGTWRTYQCTSSGWTQVDTGNSCTTDTATPTISKFELVPNIVASGDLCRITIDAENVSTCTLTRNGVPVTTSPTDLDDLINATTHELNTAGVAGVSVGSYRLSCTGVGMGAPVITFPTVRRCLSNSLIIEN